MLCHAEAPLPGRPPPPALRAAACPLSSLGLPARVHTLAWAPQADLLAQRGVKAFVTHAGQNSVSEAGWQGVPMVCLPQSADQLDNCAKVRGRGGEAGAAQLAGATSRGGLPAMLPGLTPVLGEQRPCRVSGLAVLAGLHGGPQQAAYHACVGLPKVMLRYLPTFCRAGGQGGLGAGVQVGAAGPGDSSPPGCSD